MLGHPLCCRLKPFRVRQSSSPAHQGTPPSAALRLLLRRARMRHGNQLKRLFLPVADGTDSPNVALRSIRLHIAAIPNVLHNLLEVLAVRIREVTPFPKFKLTCNPSRMGLCRSSALSSNCKPWLPEQISVLVRIAVHTMIQPQPKHRDAEQMQRL